ncbi:MAG: acyl--CoA ligase [Verrucomicrobia bacterium]|nr:acyl--CoA ligase [Verrucomicrobiota bacterium]
MVPYQLLTERAGERPEDVAFIDADRGKSATFREVMERSAALAAALGRLGVGKGDAVACLLPNAMELVELYLATGALGAVFQPIDTRFRGNELKNCLENTHVKALFAWAPFLSQELEAFVPPDVERFAVGGSFPNWREYESTLQGGKSFTPISESLESDDAVYLYTSGSTAKIKCVPMTRRQLDFFPRDLISIWNINSADRGLSLLPMSHISGPIVINLVLATGGSYVLTNRFSPDNIIKCARRYRVTWTHSVPSIGRIIAASAREAPEAFESFRLIAMMGTVVPPILFESLCSAVPSASIVQGYGLTETSPLLTLQTPGWPWEKIVSIGKALEGVEIRLIDQEGRVAGPNEPGEICVRGPRVFRGYVGNPELSARVIRNGWFHTGDVAFRDEEGCYYHLGRLDDMVIIGGLNVYPTEVENELLRHPDVAECLVYGKNDPSRGKILAADITPRPGKTIDPARLRQFLSQRLASYKIPRRIRQVSSLNYSPVGKPIRKPAPSPSLSQ